MREILLKMWHELRELRKDFATFRQLLETRQGDRVFPEALRTDEMCRFLGCKRTKLYELPIRHDAGMWNLEDARAYLRSRILPPIKVETRGKKSKVA